MRKTITKIGKGGTITMKPIRPRPSRQEITRVIKATMEDYARTLKKLA